MYLRDFAVLADEARYGPGADSELCEQFNRETGCVTDMFLFHCPKVKTQKTAKVIVDIVGGTHRVHANDIKRMLDVTFVPYVMHLQGYFVLPNFDRRKQVLIALYESLRWLGSIEGWLKNAFDIAYEECLKLELVHHFFWRKGKILRNPSRTRSIKLFCEYETDEARIFAVEWNSKTGEGSRHLLCRCLTADVIVYAVMHFTRWESDDVLTFDVREKDGEWRYSLDWNSMEKTRQLLRR
jgi:hypothetical protein